jgi:hypothetical protein
VFLNTQQGSARFAEVIVGWREPTARLFVFRSHQFVKFGYTQSTMIFTRATRQCFFHLIEPPSTSPAYKIDFANSSLSMSSLTMTRSPPGWTSPRHTLGKVFELGAAIELRAQIIGPGGSNDLWSVEFFDDDQPIGTTQVGKSIWWNDASGGPHVVGARARNSQGTLLTAEPSSILVGPGATLPVVKISADPWSTGEPCPACLVMPSILTIRTDHPNEYCLNCLSRNWRHGDSW